MKGATPLLILSSFLFAQATPVTDPYAEDMKNRYRIGLECLSETHADINVIGRAIENPLNPPDDETYKKFLACSYKKQGFQSADGKMLYGNITTFLTRSYNKDELEILEKCSSLGGDNDAEMAYNHLVCIMRSLSEIEKEKINMNEV